MPLKASVAHAAISDCRGPLAPPQQWGDSGGGECVPHRLFLLEGRRFGDAKLDAMSPDQISGTMERLLGER